VVRDDGSVRTDAIDLDIAGRRVRVVCEDPAGISLLSSALADHLVAEPAPVGYSLQVPAGNKKLLVVLDRSGFILARTKTIEEGVAVLGRHLGALLQPPKGTIRIRARVLVGGDNRLVLAGFPLFVEPTVVERRLERASHRMVDRLVADLHPDGTLQMSAAPWLALTGLRDVPGHAPALFEPTELTRVLLPRTGNEDSSRASVVSFLAAAMSPAASISDRFALAERLSEKCVGVPLGDRAARYAALPG